ncbi:MAG: hypothetical protein GY754_37060 [bacterium]|nr:hypothetical protein [bacterium]
MNNLNIKHILQYSRWIMLFLLICSGSALADTVYMKDGSRLTGKIVKGNGAVVLKNSFGVFTIDENNIIKIVETADKEKPVAVKKTAPKKKTRYSYRKKRFADTRLWTGGCLSLSSSNYHALGQMDNTLPYFLATHLSFDQGLDAITGKRHFWMPGVRLDGGYIYSREEGKMISGFLGSLGPVWALPSPKNDWGYFVFGTLAGMGYLSIENEIRKANSLTFSGQAFFGFHYSLEYVTFFAHAKYLFIYDKDIAFHSLGGEFGIGVNVW